MPLVTVAEDPRGGVGHLSLAPETLARAKRACFASA